MTRWETINDKIRPCVKSYVENCKRPSFHYKVHEFSIPLLDIRIPFLDEYKPYCTHHMLLDKVREKTKELERQHEPKIYV